MIKKLMLGAALAFGLASPALAAGFFPGFPAPSTTYGTLPMLGTECIPADTLLSGGRFPQTECVTPQNLVTFGGSPIQLTDAATIVPDASLGRVFFVTLGGNRTLGTPTNVSDGARITLFVTQDATGGRSLSYVGAFKFGGGTTPLFQTTGASAISMISFNYRNSASAWYAESAILKLQ